MRGTLQGTWGMREGESSELCVPLSRDTGDVVKCPVPRTFHLTYGGHSVLHEGCP